jgi:hypothetical protein
MRPSTERMRGSPPSAATACIRSASLRSSGTAKGSMATGVAKRPRCGSSSERTTFSRAMAAPARATSRASRAAATALASSTTGRAANPRPADQDAHADAAGPVARQPFDLAARAR